MPTLDELLDPIALLLESEGWEVKRNVNGTGGSYLLDDEQTILGASSTHRVYVTCFKLQSWVFRREVTDREWIKVSRSPDPILMFAAVHEVINLTR